MNQSLCGLVLCVMIVPLAIYGSAAFLHSAVVPPYQTKEEITATKKKVAEQVQAEAEKVKAAAEKALVNSFCQAAFLRIPMPPQTMTIEPKCDPPQSTPDAETATAAAKAKAEAEKKKADKENSDAVDRRTKLTQITVVTAGLACIIGFIGVAIWVGQQIALRSEFSKRCKTELWVYALAILAVGVVVELIAPTAISGGFGSQESLGAIEHEFESTIQNPFAIATSSIFDVARWMDAASLGLSLVVAYCAALPLDPASHDDKKDVHWAREFTGLRECLYIGAGILVLRIVWMSALLQWPLNVMTSGNDQLKGYVNGTLAFWGVVFTAMLLGTYAVASQLLGGQARRYYKQRNEKAAGRMADAQKEIAEDPYRNTRLAAQRTAEVEALARSKGLMAVPAAEIEKVLKDGGGNLAEHIAKFIAILAPLVAGPLAATITGLLK